MSFGTEGAFISSAVYVVIVDEFAAQPIAPACGEATTPIRPEGTERDDK
jgi:hypothetical protein